MNRFAKKAGSYLCRDILKCDISTKEGVEYASKNKLFTELCPDIVGIAADVLEEIIRENRK